MLRSEFPLLCKRIVFRNNCIHWIVHDRKKLILMIFLQADKSDIYAALLNPVGKFAFNTLDYLDDNIRMLLLEFTDDLWNPVNRTAEISTDPDCASFGAPFNAAIS